MSNSSNISRAVLPIPHQEYVGFTPYDAKDPDTDFPAIGKLRPPKGAPNVLVIMLDDVGFAASSTFGGPCLTPNVDKLAANGLRYSRFHTCAVCSPTRHALLTGRNPHAIGNGCLRELATPAPGYTSLRPNTAATIAMTLKLNGYGTAQFGKCHEIPDWQDSAVGPFDHWPTGGGGFEYFYGFTAAEANQYAPGSLFCGTTPVEPKGHGEDGYHFTQDMTDRAISWIRQQKALVSDQPFFAYFAPGATHAPHHVPKEWADKYKGRFDQGWDALREEILTQQKELGVLPPDTVLSARPAEIPAWDAMPELLKPVLARQMEVYAGFLEHTDHHIGRLVDALRQMQVLDNTLIYVILGDNGASGEGNKRGSFNEHYYMNNAAHLETDEVIASQIDKLGTPDAYNHYAVGWAHAMNTPYQWVKQVASHFGGTRNGTVVHWPNGFKARGEVRNQFHHVIDVAPTILEAAGLPHPTFVNGVQQMPIHGVSMLYSFDEANAKDRRTLQYFELTGNRGIYYNGWTAVTKHTLTWVISELPAFDDDVWELYDTNNDWSQSNDLAKIHPQKLHELQRLWLIEAAKYQVLPIDERRAKRWDPQVAGRPQLVKGDRQILFSGMQRLRESSILSIKNKSHAVTAQILVPKDGARGVILAQGGKFGGWSLYAKDRKLAYCYNFFGVTSYKVYGRAPIPTGEHEVRMTFTYDGGGLGKGGNVSLYVDNELVGEGRVDRTVSMCFSLDESADVGRGGGTSVSDDYAPKHSEFNGRIDWVEISIGKDSSDHLITFEDRLRAVLAYH